MQAGGFLTKEGRSYLVPSLNDHLGRGAAEVINEEIIQ
jgi:hypothetical protein